MRRWVLSSRLRTRPSGCLGSLGSPWGESRGCRLSIWSCVQSTGLERQASLLTCVDISAQLTQSGECLWACLRKRSLEAVVPKGEGGNNFCQSQD